MHAVVCKAAHEREEPIICDVALRVNEVVEPLVGICKGDAEDRGEHAKRERLRHESLFDRENILPESVVLVNLRLLLRPEVQDLRALARFHAAVHADVLAVRLRDAGDSETA